MNSPKEITMYSPEQLRDAFFLGMMMTGPNSGLTGKGLVADPNSLRQTLERIASGKSTPMDSRADLLMDLPPDLAKQPPDNTNSSMDALQDIAVELLKQIPHIP